jgi:hypothetical protein
MRLRSIREAAGWESLDDTGEPTDGRTGQRSLEEWLVNLNPDSIIRATRSARPIIFVNGKNYLGEENQYHSGLMNDVADDDPPASKMLARAYYGRAHYGEVEYGADDEYPGAVGRIAYGLIPDSGFDREALKDVQAVVYYESRSPAENMRASVADLIDVGHIRPDAYVIYNNEVARASAVVGDGVADASAEKKRRSNLQIALHLGSWPDGRRLSPEERRWAMKELGWEQLRIRNPWQQGAEAAKLVQPGQKWWAPTSEGKR